MTTFRRTARRPGLVARSRPRYTWRQFITGVTAGPSGARLAFDLSTLGPAPDLSALGVVGDFTLRRLHMTLIAQSQAASESSSQDHYTWGVYVAGNDALAAGATSLPDPESDAADWLAFGFVWASLESTGFSTGIHPIERAVVDNRSMRKVNENNQSLVLVVHVNSTNSGGVDLQAAGRFLVSHGQR